MRRLDTLREQFIQNVAHELRTPLALVHGYVEMLVQEDLGREESQMALGVVSRRVQALVDLVESITTLQDLEQTLEYYLTHPNALQRKKGIARESILKLHDNNQLGRQLIEYYKKIKLG